MRILHRFCIFNNKVDKEMIKFLNKHNIKMDYTKDFNVFEPFEDSDNFYEIKNFLASYKIYNHSANVRLIYTKEEIEAAEWLTISLSWYNGYAQPQDGWGYIHTTYDSSKMCDKCYAGLVQKDSFALKKPPKWGQRNFFYVYGAYEIFISNRVKSVFMDNNVTDVEYYDVIKYSKARNIIDDTKQIYVKTYLQPGLKDESIYEVFTCVKCGAVKYDIKKNYFYYDKKVFDGITADIVKTSESYGVEGSKGTNLIFVSQRLRKILIDNKLDKGVYFAPIQLV